MRLAGWLVNPVIKATLNNSNVTVLGIDFLADNRNKFTDLENLNNRNFWEMLTSGNDLIIGSSKTFEKTKDRLSDFSRIENEQLPADTLITDVSSAQRLLNMEGKFTYLEYINRSLGSPDKLTLKNLMLTLLKQKKFKKSTFMNMEQLYQV